MEYSLTVSPRARSIRVAVYPGGDIRVVVPRRYSARSLKDFLKQQEAWIQRTSAKMRGPVIEAKRAEITRYKREARALVSERCAYFAARYGVRFAKVTIRSQRSRWGSCSRKGNLSFNYKIALLPEHLVDYIVIHEICHLIHFDHSRGFWQEVERYAPKHRAHREELRTLAVRFR